MTKRPKTIDVLTPDHPRWDEFADALANTIVISDTEWHCDGGDGWGPNPNRYRYAKQVMNTMGNIDIPASLEFFKAHGGGCDCEILLNVDDAELQQRTYLPCMSQVVPTTPSLADLLLAVVQSTGTG